MTMRKIISLLTLGILLVGIIPFDVFAASSAVAGVTNIDRCMVLDKAGETYLLTKDVSSDGTCFEVKANNVVLDGQGHTIQYGKASGDSFYGVFINDADSVTIKNTNIKERFASGFSQHGVYVLNSEKANLINTNFDNVGDSSYSVYFSNSNFGVVDDNVILTKGNRAMGIYFDRSSNNKVVSNIITTSGWLAHGVGLFYSDNNEFSESTIKTLGQGSNGIDFYGSSNSNFLDEQVEVSGYDSDGVYLKYSSIGNSFRNLNLKISTGTVNKRCNGIHLFNNVEGNSFFDSVINADDAGSREIFIQRSSGNVDIVNTVLVKGREYFSGDASAVLNFKRYLNILVRDVNGAISNADVNIFDKNNKLVYSGKTDSEGKIEKIVLRQYSEDRNGKVYDAPYNVKVEIEGYEDMERSIQLAKNENVEFVLVKKGKDVMFVRGDVNNDHNVNIADAQFVLNYLFARGASPVCLDSADVNDNGIIEIGDAVYLLNYLFSGGKEPPEPFGVAGTDPTLDELGC